MMIFGRYYIKISCLDYARGNQTSTYRIYIQLSYSFIVIVLLHAHMDCIHECSHKRIRVLTLPWMSIDAPASTNKVTTFR